MMYVDEPTSVCKPGASHTHVSQTLIVQDVACRLISAKDCQASSDLDKRDHSRTQPSSSADGSKSSACSAGVPQPVALYGRALQWLADQAQRATELGHSYIDGMVDRGLRLLRESIPVPCMVVRRRSALRVRLHWHGFAQPVGKPRAVQTCEVYL